MMKHIGRHGDKKVAVLYRTVPNESASCLVLYSDLLPRTYHDAVMKVLESDVGQVAGEFADALFRSLLPDGRNILETLHKEGLIRKIPTSQVIITPDAKNSCRLDELNKILGDIDAGNEAKLTEAEETRGLKDPMRKKPDVTKTTSASVGGEDIDELPTPAPEVVAKFAATAKTAPAEVAAQTPAKILADMKAAMAEVKRLEGVLNAALGTELKPKRKYTPRKPKVAA